MDGINVSLLKINNTPFYGIGYTVYFLKSINFCRFQNIKLASVPTLQQKLWGNGFFSMVLQKNLFAVFSGAFLLLMLVSFFQISLSFWFFKYPIRHRYLFREKSPRGAFFNLPPPSFFLNIIFSFYVLFFFSYRYRTDRDLFLSFTWSPCYSSLFSFVAPTQEVSSGNFFILPFLFSVVLLPIDFYGTGWQSTNFRLHGGQTEIGIKYFNKFSIIICLPVCLPAYRYLPVCLSACLSNPTCACRYACLPSSRYACLLFCLPACLFVSLYFFLPEVSEVTKLTVIGKHPFVCYSRWSVIRTRWRSEIGNLKFVWHNQ